MLELTTAAAGQWRVRFLIYKFEETMDWLHGWRTHSSPGGCHTVDCVVELVRGKE